MVSKSLDSLLAVSTSNDPRVHMDPGPDPPSDVDSPDPALTRVRDPQGEEMRRRTSSPLTPGTSPTVRVPSLSTRTRAETHREVHTDERRCVETGALQVEEQRVYSPGSESPVPISDGFWCTESLPSRPKMGPMDRYRQESRRTRSGTEGCRTDPKKGVINGISRTS